MAVRRRERRSGFTLIQSATSRLLHTEYTKDAYNLGGCTRTHVTVSAREIDLSPHIIAEVQRCTASLPPCLTASLQPLFCRQRLVVRTAQHNSSNSNRIAVDS